MTNTAPTLTQLHDLSTELGQRLIQHTLTISLAESCTGGMMTSILTDISGSSNYVTGGVVSYSNFAKIHILGVHPETLEAHGAVSPETALEMAHGVRNLLKTDIAISITGIAGPGGGTPEKPVGLVYLHLAGENVDWGEMHIWPYDRIENKRATVAAGLRLALRYITERSAPASAQPASKPSQDAYPTLLVEASWRNGNWRPQAAWIEGRRQQIVGIGRQERASDDVWIMTVELSNGGRAELIADPQAGVWRLRGYWPPRRYA